MNKTPRQQQIETLLADEPNDPFLRYGLAMEHSSQGDDATAAEQLLALLDLDPAKPYIPAFLMCGQALVRLNRESEAVAVLRRGLAATQVLGTPEALHAFGELQALLSTVE